MAITSYESKQDKIKRAMAEAAALRQSASAERQPQGQMVSGHFVAPHWSQQLGPLVDSLMASAKEYGAGKEQEALEQQMQQGQQEWMQARPRAQQVELPGPQPEEAAGTPLTGTQAPTRDQQIAWASQGMNNPLTKALAAKYLEDQIIQEPVREEARVFKAEESQAARAAKREETILRLENEIKEARIRSEDKALDRAAQEEWRKRADATERARDKLMYEARMDANAARREATEARHAEKPPKPLPAAQSKAWIENNTAIKSANRVIGMLIDENGKPRKEAEAAMGIVNKVPFSEEVRQYTDPEGAPIRAAVDEIGSMEIHDRSGATVTASEHPRLKPFIPSSGDRPEIAAKKLRNFMAKYQEIQQEILDYAEDMNYRVPKVRPETTVEEALPPGVTVRKK